MTTEVEVAEVVAGVDETPNTGEELIENPDSPPDPPVEDKGLSSEDIDRISVAINHWHMHGYPEKAAVLEECWAQNRTPPANLIYFGEIQPETAIDPHHLEIPKRYGTDATKEAWLSFAKATTDMEHEILEKMQRKDLIELLEIKGVIKPEDPDKKPNYTPRHGISAKGKGKGPGSRSKPAQ